MELNYLYIVYTCTVGGEVNPESFNKMEERRGERREGTGKEEGEGERERERERKRESTSD